MPAWAIAIVSIVGSGVVASYVQVWYQRGTEMRTRMLESAGAFLDVSVAALMDLETTYLPVVTGAVSDVIIGPAANAKPVETALADLHAAIRELEMRLAAVQLLYGAQTATAAKARDVVTAVRDATNLLEYARSTPREIAREMSLFEPLQEYMTKAAEAHEAFSAAARNAVRRTARAR